MYCMMGLIVSRCQVSSPLPVPVLSLPVPVLLLIKAGVVVVFPMRKCGTRSMINCWGEPD